MHMLAQVCDMQVGELVHVIADAHIYDRHIPIIKEPVSYTHLKTTFTAKGNKFKISTVRTAIHGTNVRRITTMNHLVDIFDNRRTRMKFVNDRFIISKDRL